MNSLIALFICIAPISAMALNFDSLSEQATYFHNTYFTKDWKGKPLTDSTQITGNKTLLTGETRPKEVLRGVFYFGGSDKKDSELSGGFQNTLCMIGFTHGYSVYTQSSNNIKCDMPDPKTPGKTILNAFMYRKVGEALERTNDGGPNVVTVMRNIQKVIQANGKIGPIYLHCANGVHGSNTIAQMALKLFCGISNSEANSNWDDVNLYKSLKPESRVQLQKTKIANFNPAAIKDENGNAITITAEEKALICQ